MTAKKESTNTATKTVAKTVETAKQTSPQTELTGITDTAQDQRQESDNVAAKGPATVTFEPEKQDPRNVELEQRIAELTGQLATAQTEAVREITALTQENEQLRVKLHENEVLTKDGVINKTTGQPDVVIAAGDADASHAPDVEVSGPSVKVHETQKHRNGSEQIIETYRRPAETVDTKAKA